MMMLPRPSRVAIAGSSYGGLYPLVFPSFPSTFRLFGWMDVRYFTRVFKRYYAGLPSADQGLLDAYDDGSNSRSVPKTQPQPRFLLMMYRLVFRSIMRHPSTTAPTKTPTSSPEPTRSSSRPFCHSRVVPYQPTSFLSVSIKFRTFFSR